MIPRVVESVGGGIRVNGIVAVLPARKRADGSEETDLFAFANLAYETRRVGPSRGIGPTRTSRSASGRSDSAGFQTVKSCEHRIQRAGAGRMAAPDEARLLGRFERGPGGPTTKPGFFRAIQRPPRLLSGHKADRGTRRRDHPPLPTPRSTADSTGNARGDRRALSTRHVSRLDGPDVCETF